MNPVHYFKVLSNYMYNGNMEIQLGKYYLNNNEWGGAIQMIRKGIEKGNLTHRDEALELLASACMKAGVVL